MCRSLRASAALAALAVALPAAPGAAEREEPPVGLVLLIVVDQLRRDRFDSQLPGGLGRIAREGRVFTEGALGHAATATCPGHIAASSGRHPGPAGVPGNSFVDRERGEVVYCVEDPDAPQLGGGSGRSPRLLRVDTLGDWMKAARPGSRVFSIAGKDRSAVALGGKRPDGAYWFAGRLGFTTSSYYRSDLPAWLRDFNDDGAFLERVPERWDHETAPNGERPDAYPAESPQNSRSSGHPMRGSDPAESAARVRASPFLDRLTLHLAGELIQREGLGRGDAPDLLALGLSATDLVGHLYGPESHEARAALADLDRELDGFLDLVEREVGAGRALVALTADHGVLPLPEWLEDTGRATCPVAGGRASGSRLLLGLWWDLHRRFSLFSWPSDWVDLAGSGVTVSRSRAREHGAEVEDVIAAAERYLESHPAIARAWSADEVRTEPGPLADLYRHSYDPERSGDLLIQLEAGCLITTSDHGTTHGTPYEYDRAVPLAFWGPGVAAGAVDGPAYSIDIAPTLAPRIGIEAPPDLDGRRLF